MTQRSTDSTDTYALSGVLLAAGAILLFIGTLFFAAVAGFFFIFMGRNLQQTPGGGQAGETSAPA